LVGELPAPEQVVVSIAKLTRWFRCRRSGRAVGANHHAVLLAGEPAAVLDQKATGAGEFVGLFRYHANGELFTGQVGTG
jgi:hypothetical protein